MYQLFTQDEYGTRQIVDKDEDIKKLMLRAKSMVTSDNMDNALTLESQRNEFESYLVEFKNKKNQEVSNVFFAGRKGTKRIVYIIDDDNKAHEVELDTLGLVPMFFIGQFQKDRKKKVLESFYADSIKKKQVNDFKDEVLEGKMVYYVQKTK